MDRKALLSTLWIYILFNIILRDIHEILRPGFIEEVMTGTLNGNQLNDTLFLIGSAIAQVPIAMVLLSRLLTYRINRWANIVASVLTIAVVVSALPGDADDRVFAGFEILALLYIIWSAWTWRLQNPNPA